MKTYILKRLLLMIPTFLGITLIVFVVLNFAPGHPGGSKMNQDLAANMRGEKTQESFRIFREQFNLDKPVLFNTLFWLSEKTVAKNLQIIAGVTTATAAQKIRAQEGMEDYGQYAVPHLAHIMETAQNPRLRDVSVYFMSLNARRPLIDPFNKNLSEARRKMNTEIDIENALFREMRYPLEAPEAQKQKVIAQWKTWYQGHKNRWEYSGMDKFRIFFFETRFACYMGNLMRLDFGVSLVTKEPVLKTLVYKLRYSIPLSVGSLILAYLISIPIGIFSAARKDSTVDQSVTIFLFILYSLPSFFVATVLLYFFSKGSDYKWLQWFPIGGWRSPEYDTMTTLERIGDIGWHMVLPVICMTYGSLAYLSRYMRAGLLDVIRSDYIRTARAKGLTEKTVILKHALRNGLIPILTILAGLLPALLGGSIIIEYIFGIPGMGQWLIESIYNRDYNVIMAEQLVSTILVLLGILLSDLSYALVDPRITYD
ncbi:MAG: ABC transporter permease [Candidatus Sumerlaeota bacterium]|nr:ABC transporter permease [Candidatus Sumerlaeota bacterium]